MLLQLWNRLSKLPAGRWLFSRILGWKVPYTGSIGADVEVLEPGHAIIKLKDRRCVRNHLDSVHAVALVNLGEVTTGLTLTASLPAKARIILRSISITYHKKARGTLISEARTQATQDLSSRDVEVEANIRNLEGEIVSTLRATWRVGESRPQ